MQPREGRAERHRRPAPIAAAAGLSASRAKRDGARRRRGPPPPSRRGSARRAIITAQRSTATSGPSNGHQSASCRSIATTPRTASTMARVPATPAVGSATSTTNRTAAIDISSSTTAGSSRSVSTGSRVSGQLRSPCLPLLDRRTHDGRAAHARRPLRRPARLPVRAALRRDPRRRGRAAAGPPPRRGRPGRAGGAPPPRRADLELPLPPHDPGAGRRRPARGGARPRGLRALGQAGQAHRLHLRPPRQLAVVPRVRRPRPAGHHPRLPGLGRAARPAARRRPARPVRRRRGRQHVPAHRRRQARRRVPGVAEVLPGGAGDADRPHHQRRVHHRPPTR